MTAQSRAVQPLLNMFFQSQITNVIEVGNGFRPRTIFNARHTNGTLIYAVDDESLGTRVAVNACAKYGKPCLVVTPQTQMNTLFEWFAEEFPGHGTLNIAGNRIGTWLEHNQTEHDLAQKIYKLIKPFKEQLRQVVSGGQTGSDMAGLAAATALNVPDILVCMPIGLLYQDQFGATHKTTRTAVKDRIKALADNISC